MATLNSNPIVYHSKETRTAQLGKRRHATLLSHLSSQQPGALHAGPDSTEDESAVEQWTPEEVFELIRHINDPEHPLTLEQLRVAQLQHVRVVDNGAATEGCAGTKASTVDILFTPTIPHCSMATLIGLCLRVKLARSLPPRFKVSVAIEQGKHASEGDINKQLADKERVAAALENRTLLDVVNKCCQEGDESAEAAGSGGASQQNRPAPPFAA